MVLGLCFVCVWVEIFVEDCDCGCCCCCCIVCGVCVGVIVSFCGDCDGCIGFCCCFDVVEEGCGCGRIL